MVNYEYQFHISMVRYTIDHGKIIETHDTGINETDYYLTSEQALNEAQEMLGTTQWEEYLLLNER